MQASLTVSIILRREQKVMLRQVIAAGFVDQVAKRIPFTNEAGEAVSGKWKYITAITKQECFIHPSSFLLREHPEYIVYHELIETTKCYIKGITAISLGWMTSLGPWLCKGMDDILESPPPKYDAEKDRIRGLVQPVFVNADWLAPKTHVELSGLVAYKYFARYFLEGLVCNFRSKANGRKTAVSPLLLRPLTCVCLRRYARSLNQWCNT
jgi:ATP-dependent RNA helicase DHX37/DHR1